MFAVLAIAAFVFISELLTTTDALVDGKNEPAVLIASSPSAIPESLEDKISVTFELIACETLPASIPFSATSVSDTVEETCIFCAAISKLFPASIVPATFASVLMLVSFKVKATAIPEFVVLPDGPKIFATEFKTL